MPPPRAGLEHDAPLLTAALHDVPSPTPPQVQCVFAYIFSVWLLHEKVSCIRVGSVALCVCGTAVIMLAAVGIRIDNAADDDTSGCTCSCGTACVYAQACVCVVRSVCANLT